MIPSTGTSHPSDDDLLLYLEGGADEPLRAHAADHLRGCGECERRAGWLRRRTALLDERIAELDLTPPEAVLPRSFAEVRRRRDRRARRVVPLRWAAAVALVFLSGAMLASPVRAWVLGWATERWRDAVAVFGGEGRGPAVAAGPERAAAEAPQTEYRFAPEGGEFGLEIASTQREGTVVIRTTGDAAAVLVVQAPGAEREPVLVLPDRIRIRNSPGSTASYQLTLPGSVRSLRIRVGERPWSTLRTGDFVPGEQHVLPLRIEP